MCLQIKERSYACNAYGKPHLHIWRGVKVAAQSMHSHIKARCAEFIDDLACLAVHEVLAVWADLQVYI